jgi:ATP-dependent DNA ligase
MGEEAGRGRLSPTLSRVRREILDGLGLKDERWQVTTPSPARTARPCRRPLGRRASRGIVAKRVRSLYRCGERSADWVKVKNYQTETFTIGGWVTDEAGLLHSLLVGQREGRGLRYAGEIEYGFRPGERARLETLLESLTRSESSFIGLRL